jgi:hypothetical protein
MAIAYLAIGGPLIAALKLLSIIDAHKAFFLAAVLVAGGALFVYASSLKCPALSRQGLLAPPAGAVLHSQDLRELRSRILRLIAQSPKRRLVVKESRRPFSKSSWVRVERRDCGPSHSTVAKSPEATDARDTWRPSQPITSAASA